MFIFCDKCGKKLIYRRDDGTLVFRFGKSHKEKPIVDIEIFGDIKLTCLRRSCEHITVLKSNGHEAVPAS